MTQTLPSTNRSNVNETFLNSISESDAQKNTMHCTIQFNWQEPKFCYCNTHINDMNHTIRNSERNYISRHPKNQYEPYISQPGFAYIICHATQILINRLPTVRITSRPLTIRKTSHFPTMRKTSHSPTMWVTSRSPTMRMTPRSPTMRMAWRTPTLRGTWGSSVHTHWMRILARRRIHDPQNETSHDVLVD